MPRIEIIFVMILRFFLDCEIWDLNYELCVSKASEAQIGKCERLRNFKGFRWWWRESWEGDFESGIELETRHVWRFFIDAVGCFDLWGDFKELKGIRLLRVHGWLDDVGEIELERRNLNDETGRRCSIVDWVMNNRTQRAHRLVLESTKFAKPDEVAIMKLNRPTERWLNGQLFVWLITQSTVELLLLAMPDFIIAILLLAEQTNNKSPIDGCETTESLDTKSSSIHWIFGIFSSS